MPDTYTSQFSGEEIDAALRAAQIISGASTLAELRNKLEIRGDTIPVSAEDSTLISDAVKYRTNPNLLDNWYFGRPVNQRGQTEYTVGGVCTIDRWALGFDGTMTATLTNDGIKLVAGNDGTYNNLFQVLPDVPTNTTITVSFLVDNYASISHIYSFFSSSQFDIQDNLVSVTFKTGSSIHDRKELGIQIKVGKTATIKAAKLELGDTQTLAHKENGVWVLNEIPDFGEQLRRCMYYAEKVEDGNTPVITNATFIPAGATSATFVLPYERKRTPPSIRFNDVSNYRVIVRSMSGNTTAFGISNISILDVGTTKASVLVTFSSATSQDWYGYLQRADNTSGGYAFISADL